VSNIHTIAEAVVTEVKTLNIPRGHAQRLLFHHICQELRLLTVLSSKMHCIDAPEI
jgi:hypothetical protein